MVFDGLASGEDTNGTNIGEKLERSVMGFLFISLAKMMQSIFGTIRF